MLTENEKAGLKIFEISDKQFIKDFKVVSTDCLVLSRNEERMSASILNESFEPVAFRLGEGEPYCFSFVLNHGYTYEIPQWYIGEVYAMPHTYEQGVKDNDNFWSKKSFWKRFKYLINPKELW